MTTTLAPSPIIGTPASPQTLASRIASCDSALRREGANCTFVSESGSRYFNLGTRRIRVSDHCANGQGTQEDRWHDEIRVDLDDWRDSLASLADLSKPSICDIPAGVYFSDDAAVSQSMLKTFMDRRRLYDAYYVSRTAEPPDPTPPMQKGTATHTALLEPDRFERLVVKYPASVLAKNGAVSTNEAKAFRDEHEAAGRVVLKEADYKAIQAMADSVRRVCGKWLALPGKKEHSVYWTDQPTGLKCKARTDWIIEVDDTAFVFDIKTTADVRPNVFARRCADAGYWLQHDHYCEGVEAAIGLRCEFRFVVVESDYPFSCAIYTLHERSAYVAGLARRNLLRQLAECIDTGDWSDQWEREVLPLAMPAWAFDENLR